MLVNLTEPVKIDIAPIEDIDAVRYEVQKSSGGADIRTFAIRNDGKRGNMASQIQLAM